MGTTFIFWREFPMAILLALPSAKLGLRLTETLTDLVSRPPRQVESHSS